MVLGVPAAQATTFRREANLADLIGQSELILHGTITKLTDGIDDQGIPYTEVTVHVVEVLRGQVSGDYTFRQFGLLKPRKMANGEVNLMVTPAGWATYTKGEDTILFLHKHAAWTGLQTTAGLGQGKFKIEMAGAVNQFNNAGLFKNMNVVPSLLSARDKRVMMTEKGAVNANAFVALVKQAVQSKWVENGSMRSVQK
jgi:hypothetical protein